MICFGTSASVALLTSEHIALRGSNLPNLSRSLPKFHANTRSPEFCHILPNYKNERERSLQKHCFLADHWVDTRVNIFLPMFRNMFFLHNVTATTPFCLCQSPYHIQLLSLGVRKDKICIHRLVNLRGTPKISLIFRSMGWNSWVFPPNMIHLTWLDFSLWLGPVFHKEFSVGEGGKFLPNWHNMQGFFFYKSH